MWTWPTFDGTIHVMRRHTFTSPHENRWWVLEWADENGDLDHFYIEELGDRRFTAHYNPHEGGEDETFHYDPTNIDCVITLEGGVEPSKSDE